jgi:DNA-binding NarL/FixJ family response regulator
MSDEVEKPKRVFIADDSPIIRERLASLLGELENVVIAGQAEDLPEVIRAIPGARPDYVILDIRMPGGSGIDALKFIKRSLAAPVVIILTNYPSPEYRQACLQEGADYFFDKSHEFEQVLEVIGRGDAKREK